MKSCEKRNVWCGQAARLVSLMLCLALLPVSVVVAQEAHDPEVDWADDLGRETPHGSAQGFLLATDSGDYETAAEYLDLRNLRGDAKRLTGAQLARRMEVIVHRAKWLDIDELVDDPAGRRADGLPEYRDSIGVVDDNGKEVRLLMQHVPRGDGQYVWKISNATVSQIPALYETFGYATVIEELRRALPKVSFLGYELFKWVVALVCAVIAYLIVFLIALTIKRVLRDPERASHQLIFRFLIRPFGIWAMIMAMNGAAVSLGRGVTAENISRFSPVPDLITLWMLFSAINLARVIYEQRLQDVGRPAAVMLMKPISNALKLIVFLAAVLVYLDGLGINITTVLAGLGVGGIAVALALQKPMEDIFGAITLYTQQPVRVGDFCRIGNETGTIEEIGLRTTTVRTLGNSLIAIPNSRLAGEPIDNISARRKILYRTSLRLGYDSTPEQVQGLLEALREHLAEHGKVHQDSARVRFVEIANDALRIEVFAYLKTRVWTDYLAIAEELNLSLLQIVASSGTSLSLPATRLQIEQAGR